MDTGVPAAVSSAWATASGRVALMAATAAPWAEADALLVEAMAKRQTGAVGEALSLAQRAFDIDPANADVAHLIGVAARERGNLTLAGQALAHAIALAPQSHRACNDLGLVRLREGRAHEALALFDTAVSLAPGRLGPALNRANALAQLARGRLAVDAYRQLRRDHPGHVGVLANLAATLEREGALKAAVQIVREALAGDREHVTVNLTAARLERRAGQLAKSVRRLERMLGRRPDQPVAAAIHYELGRTLDALERPEQAWQAYRRGNRIARRLCEQLSQRDPASAADAEIGPLAGHASPGAALAQAMAASVARAERLAPVQGPPTGDANPGDTTRAAVADGVGGSAPAMDPERVRPHGDVAPSPVFVLACPAAGLDDLATALRRHTRALVVLESGALALAAQHLDASLAAGPAAADLGRHVQVARDVYAQVSARQGAREGALTFDIGATHLLRVELARALHPGARFVFLERHPADLVVNAVARGFRPSTLAALFTRLPSAVKTCGVFVAQQVQLRRQLGDAAVTVRYEQLIRDPRTTLAQMYAALGLSGVGADRSGRTPATADLHEPLPPGRWEAYWPWLAEYAPALADMAERLGYPLEPPAGPSAPVSHAARNGGGHRAD